MDISTQEIFRAGDAIEVIAGPLKTLTAVFQNLKTIANGEVRAIVLIELMGNQLLELQPSDLRVAA